MGPIPFFAMGRRKRYRSGHMRAPAFLPSLSRLLSAAAGLGLTLAACGSDPPEPAQTVIESSVEPGTNGSANCNISSTQWITIGDYGNVSASPPTSPIAVKNGDAFNGRAVAVDCKVERQGTSFAVTANAQINGTEGGAITVNGLFTPQGTQNGINITFSRADYGLFKGAMNCTAEYNSGQGITRGFEPLMGVAAGRVWARAVCEKIEKTDEAKTRSCRGIVMFRFENCAQ